MTVSLSNRLPEIADRIEEEPDFLNKLATAMSQVSHGRAIATSFRLAAIPQLQQCLQTMHHTLARKHIVRFIYHIHWSLQHRGHAANKAVAQRAKTQFRAAAEKLQKARSSLRAQSVEGAKRELMHEHLVSLLDAADGTRQTAISVRVPVDRAQRVPLGVQNIEAVLSGEADGLHGLDVEQRGGLAQLEDKSGPEPSSLEEDMSDPFCALAGSASQLTTLPEFFAPAPMDTLALRDASRSHTLFYRIRNSAAGQRHTMPLALGSGRSLRKRDLIVSVHHALFEDSETAGSHLKPIVSGVGRGSELNILTEFEHASHDLLEHAMLWDVDTVGYSFVGVTEKVYRDVLLQLCRLGAYPDCDRVLEIPALASAGRTALEYLASRGFVKLVHRAASSSNLSSGTLSWQLTAFGVTQMVTCQTYSNPRMLFNVRFDIPLCERSRWELVAQLLEEGWCPLVGRHAKLPAYAVADVEGVRQFVMKPSTYKAYFVCLLAAELLHAGGYESIEHGETSAYYQRMLRDCGIMQLPALADIAGPGPVHALEEDVEYFVEAPAMALEDEPATELAADALDDGYSTDGGDDWGDVDLASIMPTAGLPSSLNFSEGVFAFTLKAKRGARGYELAWQCNCPFHKRSSVPLSGCKKAIGFRATDTTFNAVSSAVLRRLKYWASQAPFFDRQWKHIRSHPPVLEELPHEAASHASLNAPLVVLSDGELEKQEDPGTFT